MKYRSFFSILLIVLITGFFFQYNRTDGFVFLIKNTNETKFKGDYKSTEIPENAKKKRYLIIYDTDDSNSVLLKKNIEKMLDYMKKDVEIINVTEKINSSLLKGKRIIIACENVDKIENVDVLFQYVYEGGRLFFLERPRISNFLAKTYLKLGIKTFTDYQDTVGLEMKSNILIGTKGLCYEGDWFDNSSLKVRINQAATLHMTSLSELPLLWETTFGKGNIVVYNGSNLIEKSNRGLIVGILSLGERFFVYPVIGIKTAHIDDFPAPIPEGHNESIFAEYHLSIADFFREVWWPNMLQMAEKYDVKFSSFIIETYNAKVKPPFFVDDRITKNNLIIYGRELLKSGGELGIHGYNHQSLVPRGYIKQELGYNSWDTKENMILSLLEFKRYFRTVFPAYTLKTYVPPSNILSPMGRQALRDVFPEIEIISSVYMGEVDEYTQEFERSEDGILELPRIENGYISDNLDIWNILNAITSLGVFSHFVHPDDILDPERNYGKAWKKLFEEYISLNKMIYEDYGWLRSCTLSQGGEYLIDFLDSDYYIEEKDEELIIYCTDFRNTLYLILRTPKKLKSYQGCKIKNIDTNTYLLKVFDTRMNLSFESEE